MPRVEISTTKVALPASHPLHSLPPSSAKVPWPTRKNAKDAERMAIDKQPSEVHGAISSTSRVNSHAAQSLTNATREPILHQDAEVEDKDAGKLRARIRLKESEETKMEPAGSQPAQADFDAFCISVQQKLLFLEDKLRQTEAQHGSMTKELDILRQAEARYGDTLQELDTVKEELRWERGQHKRTLRELGSIKDALRREEAEHERTRASLKERAAELHSANLFLNQGDLMSVADIITMVNALNAEILQGAAVLADSLDYGHRRATLTPEAIAETKAWVGEDLAQALLVHVDEFDPTVVQLALQVCLVHICKWIIETWTFTNDAAFEKIYQKIYRKGE
ncbi:hypothetical protein H0H81_009308 [Sphagnurus paluster]|uniref:Uncharacterized protein n=1 Tax=Sphagnurus paluster TaxID=117069 RepID=A0A9P7FRN7_9AGAR|nr:hypothetical protein H0H81_009308 [Sphagnurus paluster]